MKAELEILGSVIIPICHLILYSYVNLVKEKKNSRL